MTKRSRNFPILFHVIVIAIICSKPTLQTVESNIFYAIHFNQMKKNSLLKSEVNFLRKSEEDFLRKINDLKCLIERFGKWTEKQRALGIEKQITTTVYWIFRFIFHEVQRITRFTCVHSKPLTHDEKYRLGLSAEIPSNLVDFCNFWTSNDMTNCITSSIAWDVQLLTMWISFGNWVHLVRLSFQTLFKQTVNLSSILRSKYLIS